MLLAFLIFLLLIGIGLTIDYFFLQLIDWSGLKELFLGKERERESDVERDTDIDKESENELGEDEVVSESDRVSESEGELGKLKLSNTPVARVTPLISRAEIDYSNLEDCLQNALSGYGDRSLYFDVAKHKIVYMVLGFLLKQGYVATQDVNFEYLKKQFANLDLQASYNDTNWQELGSAVQKICDQMIAEGKFRKEELSDERDVENVAEIHISLHFLPAFYYPLIGDNAFQINNGSAKNMSLNYENVVDDSRMRAEHVHELLKSPEEDTMIVDRSVVAVYYEADTQDMPDEVQKLQGLIGIYNNDPVAAHQESDGSAYNEKTKKYDKPTKQPPMVKKVRDMISANRTILDKVYDVAGLLQVVDRKEKVKLEAFARREIEREIQIERKVQIKIINILEKLKILFVEYDLCCDKYNIYDPEENVRDILDKRQTIKETIAKILEIDSAFFTTKEQNLEDYTNHRYGVSNECSASRAVSAKLLELQEKHYRQKIADWSKENLLSEYSSYTERDFQRQILKEKIREAFNLGARGKIDVEALKQKLENEKQAAHEQRLVELLPTLNNIERYKELQEMKQSNPQAMDDDRKKELQELGRDLEDINGCLSEWCEVEDFLADPNTLLTNIKKDQHLTEIMMEAVCRKD